VFVHEQVFIEKGWTSIENLYRPYPVKTVGALGPGVSFYNAEHFDVISSFDIHREPCSSGDVFPEPGAGPRILSDNP